MRMQDEVAMVLRTHDRDRYLASLLAPDTARPQLQALYAFNAEIERIRDTVSEPQIGLIRQQWWRDTLDAAYRGEALDHPVAQALAKLVAMHKMPRKPLEALINVRAFDLYADQMPTLHDLEAYLGETDASLIQLSCLILDPVAAPQAAEAAGLIGVAHGAVRHLARPSRLPQLVPSDHDHGSLLAHAETRWVEARRSTIPRSLWPAFLPAAPTLGRIKALRKGKDAPQWQRQWRMWRASRKGL
jgi:15-cis-phytoene synthase